MLASLLLFSPIGPIYRLVKSRSLLTAISSYPTTTQPLRRMSTNKLSIKSTFPLPGSKYQIPQIGFGVYLSPPEKCVNSCLKALEAGYRHIDTAQYYANESDVGNAIQKGKVPREEVYLTTKILSPGKDADSTYKTVVESVEKLAGKVGYVDMFLIHSPNGGADARELMWQALEKAKEEGLVRDIGVSNYGIQHIEEIKSIGKVFPPAINQIEVRRVILTQSLIRLTRTSCIHGASSANASNTARRTTSSSKPTAHSFAMKRQTTRHSSAYARSTTWDPIKSSCDGVCKEGSCLYPRVTHHPELSATPTSMASSSTRTTWPS